MSATEIQRHLKNPWMTRADLDRLLSHVNLFLTGGPLPNLEHALFGAPFIVRHPWRCAKPNETDAPIQTPGVS